MIKFLNLKNQICEGGTHFAFYDTTSTSNWLLSFNNLSIFNSIEELKKQFKGSFMDEPGTKRIDKLIALIPEGYFVNNYNSIDYHIERIKAIQNAHDKNGFKKNQGSLMARVFLRRTGAINDHKGNYVINEKDIVGWFENGDYLKMVTEWDTM